MFRKLGFIAVVPKKGGVPMMNKLFLVFVLSISFSASICKADMITPNAQIPPSVLNKQNVHSTQNSSAIELQKITVTYHQKKKSLMSVDEATAMKGPVVPPLPASNKYKESMGLISRISPDYKVNRNFLSLSKVSINRHKEALTFVFFMNHDKVDSPQTSVGGNKPHKRLHILGPKSIFPEQKVFDNEYPVDVSVAKYDDGFAEQEWNFILPNKKPREIRVALMWSF